MGLKGGPTQDEVMAVSLAKLKIRPGDRVADVGCGTGKVAIAASKIAEHVYAIDKRSEAIACARGEAAAVGAGNIEFFEGDAVDILPGIGRLDAAFVGGSRRLPEVLALLADAVQGRIVVNAVMVGTLSEAIASMQRLGIFVEAVHLQVSRSAEIAGGVMFKPINPVYVIVGGSGCS
ncbi:MULTISPECIES: precorrin-6Y C5,15-methyltransferase (decarboxylating) subunit CbiT [unclassified Methanoculleus]|jgi:cobalt-precorrin-6B (C15)-methyltransferase|uniref:Precorrin-6Y C5,15-methyltransferase (Decarboxylating) subunit CbiT n=1 Tax=Methanoculleus palmolei TaxID=72612 RepID=A0ABD8A850_9EURY|nr:precorrin-6Y C5,15-methyltransferase (decarboxylating) subunit CbiT [Methanoculleus sp. UBA377]MDD2472515.1 precorrin-6Y C5,15-methyltransferase (decarboxylating) subunit CbiT [Methanoculleus sp.]WOX55202.1 precorrin-6Y C5,15-methyltransferase (decarboxylating) subunit CbiT [Methanoculleus palmolei]